MTETIIDGIVVSGCKFFLSSERCQAQIVFKRNEIIGVIKKPYGEHLECNLCPNCYYKQLQQLKKENNRLKSQLDLIKERCEKYIADEADLTPEQIINIIEDKEFKL